MQVAGRIPRNKHVPTPDAWATAFGNPIVAAAMLDRLLHHGVVVGIDGPSYRLRSHQARAEALRVGAEVRPHVSH